MSVFIVNGNIFVAVSTYLAIEIIYGEPQNLNLV